FGDGHLSVATANFGSASMSVLRGNGDGTFGPETSYAIGTDASGIVADDFNGDGAPDLAVLHTNRGRGVQRGDISIVLNRNDGTAPARHAGAKSPHQAAARAHRAQPDATLGRAVAPTPAALSLDTTASAPSAGPRVSPADAYFAALAAVERDL